jgi:monofunctional biosynthetic peptidoglycan transglycosylase
MKLLFLSLIMAAGMTETQEPRELCSFSKTNEAWNWRITNDGVMGGLSRGKFRITEQETGIFEGDLSLENNGGFSWVRTAKGDPDLSGSKGIRIRFKGDGRTYAVTLDTSAGYNAYSYNYYFPTEKDTWQTLEIPYSEFKAYWFGRKMPMMRIGNPAKIRDIGFIIMDKKSGPFRLEIDSISSL